MFKPEFKQELTALINRHSVDTVCATPDFLLADFVVKNLEGLKKVTEERANLQGVPFDTLDAKISKTLAER